MSSAFQIYTGIFIISLGLAIAIIGFKRLKSLTRLGPIFLFVFTITYWFRPLFTDLLRDTFQLKQLQVSGLDLNLAKMSVGVSIALISFAIGYRLGDKRVRKGPTAVYKLLPYSTLTKNLLVAWCIMLLLVGYVSTLETSPIGMSDEGISSITTEGGTIYTGNAGYLLMASMFVSAGALLIYSISGNLLLALAISAPWLVMRVYIGWGRAVHLFFLIAFLAAWGLMFRLKRVGKKQLPILAILILTALVIAPVTGANRGFFQEGEPLNLSAFKESASDWLASTSMISGYEATLYLFQVIPDAFPYAEGGAWVYRYFIQWIPRGIWPNKPIPTDFTGLVDPRFYGSAPGSVGEAYWNFSWPGIAIVFIVTGLILKWIERKYEASKKSPVAIAAYSAAFATVIQLGRDSLVSMIPTALVLWGIPFLVALGIEKYSCNNKLLIMRKFRKNIRG